MQQKEIVFCQKKICKLYYFLIDKYWDLLEGNYGTQKHPWPQKEWRGSGEAGKKKKQRDFCVVVDFVLFLLCVLFVFLLVYLFWSFFFCFFFCLLALIFFLHGGAWQGWGEYKRPGDEWNQGKTLKESINELLRGKK